MLKKHQLTGPNFNEWLRSLKLVVRTEKFQDVFETPLPPAPAASADNQALADWNALFDRHNEVACLMLGTMSPKLYHQFENKSSQEMITELQKMYGKPLSIELQELVSMFHSFQQAEGQSASDHVLLMKSYLDQLATLNYAFPDKVKSIKRNKLQLLVLSLPPQLRRFKVIDPDRLSFNIEVEEHNLGDLNEPANYKAALSDPEFEKWLVAMNEEMQSMNDNKVWKLVVLPPNAKVVKSMWIYKKKTDMDGKGYIYKARLVAKGFTQTYGVDYEETFSPVADISAVRILIAIAAYYDYEIWQMDVKTAFLNGFLEEEIYMEQPEGFIDPNHPSKVCKLQRSIYGLKQASRSWNKRFDEEIKKFGFHQNLDEPCVYQKASRSNVIFLILYVDDIILMGNHIPRRQEVKDYLGKRFSMKDLGEAAFILGIKIYRDRSRRLIGLSQNAYLDKILKRYRMDNSKRGSIPMQVDLHLNKIPQCATTSARLRQRTAMLNFIVDAGSDSRRIEMNKISKLEAEYIAASEAAKEVVWIRKFIDETLA
ncbi:retrotransposon protein, putative, ty1-copia subclass [Tanacetum coccineum]|uniref:Retrotransposon protein, putative, ty1-copia subclass n=1 Tax=Tanacetum coccineum TaxID=301880 RepID=A0ABQ5HZ74_9ASTR